jgi:hypothetical protein
MLEANGLRTGVDPDALQLATSLLVPFVPKLGAVPA